MKIGDKVQDRFSDKTGVVTGVAGKAVKVTWDGDEKEFPVTLDPASHLVSLEVVEVCPTCGRA